MNTNFTTQELEQLKNLIAPANKEQFEKLLEPKEDSERGTIKGLIMTGDKVQTRNGEIYLAIEGGNTYLYGRQVFVLLGLNTTGFLASSSYDSAMECRGSDGERISEYDVVGIYRDKEGFINRHTQSPTISGSYKPVWKRTN